LRPDQYSGPASEPRTPGSWQGSFIRGGYSIPTIALASILPATAEQTFKVCTTYNPKFSDIDQDILNKLRMYVS